MNDLTNIDPIRPTAEGFRERLEPKAATEEEGVFFFKCTRCGGVHFRHAGYIKSLLPFLRPGGERRVDLHHLQVQVCVKCRASYVWLNEQMYDVTEQIDLEAWERLERDAHRATGPGGDC